MSDNTIFEHTDTSLDKIKILGMDGGSIDIYSDSNVEIYNREQVIALRDALTKHLLSDAEEGPTVEWRDPAPRSLGSVELKVTPVLDMEPFRAQLDAAFNLSARRA